VGGDPQFHFGYRTFGTIVLLLIQFYEGLGFSNFCTQSIQRCDALVVTGRSPHGFGHEATETCHCELLVIVIHGVLVNKYFPLICECLFNSHRLKPTSGLCTHGYSLNSQYNTCCMKISSIMWYNDRDRVYGWLRTGYSESPSLLPSSVKKRSNNSIKILHSLPQWPKGCDCMLQSFEYPAFLHMYVST